MMRLCLSDLTDQFLECEDGADALPAFAEFMPDWVLMDWEMRTVDGLTAARQLLERFPSARIMLVTQYDDPELRQTAADSGVRGFFRKDELFKLKRTIAA